MTDRVEFVTADEDETHAAGMRLAGAMEAGMRIGLSGELGAGKTCFVRGLAEGLGIDPESVRSPSFALIIPYEGGRLPLVHIDLYRLPSGAMDPLELREYLYGDAVCAVEWFEHLAEPLEDWLEIQFTFVGASARRLVAVAHGLRYRDALRKVCATL